MNRNVCILTLVWWVVLSGICIGQYRVERNYLTADDGLSQNVVTDIVTDRRGYLWIGTRDGLNRFDGFSVINFAHNPVDSTSLSFSLVTTLFEDSNLRMWVGTDHGLNLYHRKRNTFERFYPSSTRSGNRVFDMTETSEGKQYVLFDSGLFRVEETDMGFNLMYLGDAGPIVESRENINDIHLYPWGDDLLAIDNLKRPFIFDVDEQSWFRVDIEIPNTSNILAIARRDSSTFYIGDRQDLYEVNFSELKSIPVKTLPQDITALGMMDDRLIIGTYNMGFYGMLTKATGDLTRMSDVYVDENVVSTPRVIAPGQDSLIWVGTNGYGVSRLGLDQRRFGLLQYDKNNRSSIMNTSIRGILPLSEEEWLIGGYSGLEIFSMTDLESEPVFNRADPTFRKKYGALIDAVPFELVRQRSDSAIIWIGTEGQGLLRYSFRDDHIEGYRLPGGIEANTVRQLLEYRTHHWLVGTAKGIFNMRYNDEGGLHTESIVETEDISVHTLIRIDTQRVMAGTADQGFLIYHIETDSTTKVDIFKNEDLVSAPIYTLLQDCSQTDTTYWAGTQIGLMKLDSSFDLLKLYTVADGLPNTTIYGLEPDTLGEIWMSTNNGLSAFNPNTEQFTNYGVVDGLQSREFNRNAYASYRSSILMFGGIRGLNYFRPAEVRNTNSDYPVYLHQISANSATYDIDLTGRTDRNFEFHESDREIRVQFSTPIFNNPNSSSYFYRIPEFSNEWLTVPGNSGELLLQNLYAGEYRVDIVRSGLESIDQANPASFYLTVIPPFYKKGWVQVAFLVLVISGVWIGYRRRMQALVREQSMAREYSQKLLQFHEEERLRIANALHDSVGNDLMVTKMALSKANDEADVDKRRDQMEKSVQLLNETVKTVRTISHNLHPHLLEKIGLSKTVQALIDQLEEVAPFSISHHIDSLADELSDDRAIHLFRFIQECLTNTVKHSEANHCRVELLNDGNRILFSISDDGKGFNIDSVKASGSIFGLTSLEERANLLSAQLKIDSTPGKGTRIELQLSLSV